MNNDIVLLSNNFLTSNEKNLQLDFFRDNGQVLLQVYKQYDVNNWDLEFYSTDINSIVIEIHFHKDKTNNELNFMRFKKSELSKKFIELEKNSYFYRLESKTSKNEFIEFIFNTINIVYEIKNKKFDFTLNAY
ncbi:hypothetical protein [Tenacibaculum geojense]|uniref:Uncharacterized protein n=1 Tax=Tenacibaculum geojense TaxID=915352 RepID=A0ABW3JQ13_9FLAO